MHEQTSHTTHNQRYSSLARQGRALQIHTTAKTLHSKPSPPYYAYGLCRAPGVAYIVDGVRHTKAAECKDYFVAGMMTVSDTAATLAFTSLGRSARHAA